MTIQYRNVRHEKQKGECDEAFDRDAIRINFKDCVFWGNHEMGNTKDWPCASFEACDLSFEAASVPAGTTYDDLIERYRKLAADPNAFPDAYGAGEQNFLMIASEMDLIEEENVSDMFGYAIQDLWAWEPEYMYLSMTPFSAID